MPKKKRKLKFVLLMILSVFLLFTGCGRRGREIVPAQETADGSETAKGAEKERLEKRNPKGDPPETEETSAPAQESPELGPEKQGSGNLTAEGKNIHNEKSVVVHVCGAVNNPGIYTLPEGSRLWEAVEAAGGARPDGAKDYLNMAAPVSDGGKVVVPFLADVEEPFGESETLRSQPGSGAADGGSPEGGGTVRPVNLNTAGLEQLMTLPGIGESKAKDILEYREKTGPFAVPEDITNVPGIKNGSYEKLKDYITV